MPDVSLLCAEIEREAAALDADIAECAADDAEMLASAKAEGQVVAECDPCEVCERKRLQARLLRSALAALRAQQEALSLARTYLRGIRDIASYQESQNYFGALRSQAESVLPDIEKVLSGALPSPPLAAPAPERTE